MDFCIQEVVIEAYRMLVCLFIACSSGRHYLGKTRRQEAKQHFGGCQYLVPDSSVLVLLKLRKSFVCVCVRTEP